MVLDLTVVRNSAVDGKERYLKALVTLGVTEVALLRHPTSGFQAKADYNQSNRAKYQ